MIIDEAIEKYKTMSTKGNLMFPRRPDIAEKSNKDYKQTAEWLEELKLYKEAEENGLLLKIPFPLETKTVYVVDYDDKEIYKLDYSNLSIKKMPVSGKIIYDIDCFEFDLEELEKYVFLTQEEAEQKLKEMEK